MSDARKVTIKPSFGGRNFKSEEALSFYPSLRIFFSKKYSKRDKKRATFFFFLIDKARVGYDTVKKDKEGHGIRPIRSNVWENWYVV